MITGSHGHEASLIMIGAKLLGSLFFVLALFLAGVFLVRLLQKHKFLSPRRSDNEIEIRQTRSIGPKSQIALVSVGRESFLVGIAPSGISLLGRIEDPGRTSEAPPAPASPSRPLQSALLPSPVRSDPGSFDAAVREALDRIGAVGRDRTLREKSGRWGV